MRFTQQSPNFCPGQKLPSLLGNISAKNEFFIKGSDGMQEFNISTILTRMRQGWRTPLVFAVILALFTLATLSGAKPVYRVTMTVVPAPSDQSAQTVASGGALSTLLGLNSGGNVNYARYQKLLSSTVVAQRLQDKYGMLQFVFRGSWDAKRQVWVPHYQLRDYLLGWLLRWSNVPTWSPPSITTLALYLQSSLVIIPSTGSDIVTISMDSSDVDFATRLMLTAHEQANQVLRDQVAKRANQQVAYLQGKLGETSVQDYRVTLLAILGNEEKTLMLTQTDASYAAEILSPPIASATPIAPRPVLSMFVAVLVGVLAGLAVVIFLGPLWWLNLLDRFRSLRRTAGGNKALAARR